MTDHAIGAAVGDLDGDGRADDFVSFDFDGIYLSRLQLLNLTAEFLEGDSLQFESMLSRDILVHFRLYTADRIAFDYAYDTPQQPLWTSSFWWDSYAYNQTRHCWQYGLDAAVFFDVGTYLFTVTLSYLGYPVAVVGIQLVATIYLPVGIGAAIIVAVIGMLYLRHRRHRD